MARQFNGTSDIITYPHLSQLDGLTKFIIAFNYTPQGTPSEAYGRIIAQEAADGTQGFMVCHNFVNQLSVLVRCANGSSQYLSPASDIFTDNVLNRVVLAFDGTHDNGALYFFIGGTQVYANVVNSTSLGTVTEGFSLGADGLGNNGKGVLSEVAMWAGLDVPPWGQNLATPLAVGVSAIALSPRPFLYIPVIDKPHDWRGTAGAGTITGTTLSAHPRTFYPGVTFVRAAAPATGDKAVTAQTVASTAQLFAAFVAGGSGPQAALGATVATTALMFAVAVSGGVQPHVYQMEPVRQRTRLTR